MRNILSFSHFDDIPILFPPLLYFISVEFDYELRNFICDTNLVPYIRN
jgi:hypothetical protein